MLLTALLGPEIATPAAGVPATLGIAGITADSRKVQAGWLFAALSGTRTDGSRFVADAVSKGAAAVLVHADGAVEVPAGVAVLRATNPRRALALMAARFYREQPAHIAAVTGTSGKTSVVEFTRQILAANGHRAASLGTIGLIEPDGSVYASLTTPDPVSLHAALADLTRKGVTHLAFEASSHGLDQHRLDGVRIEAAAFTNLGRDHLDYHPDVESYLAAKLRLFTELLPAGATAVVNADGARAQDAADAARGAGRPVFTTGRAGSDLRLARLERDGFAQALEVFADGRTHTVQLPLLGAYQVENALVAAGLAIALGCETGKALDALSSLRGVTGRLEIVARHNGGLAVVDYAHKPEALAAALDAVRPFATGRLVCIMGCGGDRDRGKRPIMGRIAAERADVVVITDDNPRSEDPATIRAEILAAAPGAREIGDRGTAIATAMAEISKGDVVLVAGKGHETGQIVGDVVLPFSDHDAVRRAVG